MRSRPRRALRTRPAADSTSRCLVIAWCDTFERARRRAVEPGPCAERRARSSRRVSSPRAANSVAAALARDMGSDVSELGLPAPFVHAEGLGAAPRGDAVEAGLDDG